MKLEPFGDRIVALPAEEPTVGGLILAQGSKERPVVSVVIALGEDVKKIKVGDRVCYTRYAPNEVELDKKTYIILKEEDILARILS